jgi:hypothetical protein
MKRTSRVIILISSLGFIFYACGTGKTSDKPSKTDTTIVTQTPPIDPATVILKCVDKGMDEYENPINEVVLSINGKDSVIARTSACAEITKAQYKEMQIPAEATSACGGWWAGGGDYFYAVVVNEKVKVFRGWQEEGQEDDGYHWKEMDLNEKAK